jgi:hypothetical protein
VVNGGGTTGQGFVKLKLFERERAMAYLTDALSKSKALDVRALPPDRGGKGGKENSQSSATS